MALIEFEDLASIGVNRDVEDYRLLPEGWSLGDNMRFEDDGVLRSLGRTQIFGTPGVAPHFAMPVFSGTQTFWLYTSLLKGYVYNGTNHFDITNSGANYTGTNTREWNATLLGGVPILNNGIDEPQFWASYNTATLLADLTNWPTGDSARVFRAFGPYLMAFDVTESSTRFPHMVKWSHPAIPGGVPSSWDTTDATKDAGKFDLPDTAAGIILDALPLRGRMYVYKEGSTWQISQIGGRFVFQNKSLWDTSGIIAPRCVTTTGEGSRHVVATQDDIIVHNGASIQSILDKRYKKYLFNQIDTTNYLNCFMFTNARSDEVWFCYPESGQTQPSRALVWNYRQGQRGALSEVEVDFRNAVEGVIESPSEDTWTSVTEAWNTATEPWSRSERRKVVVSKTSATKFLELDSGSTNDGTAILGTLQRTGLAVVGRKRNGDPIVDFVKRKQVNRVWIKASGGPINVRVGFQPSPGGNVTWKPAVSFDPTTDKYIDSVGSGSAVGIEFSAAVPFRITGYKLEGDVIGEF